MKKIGIFLDEINDQSIGETEKFKRVGFNTGNLLFWHSLKKTLNLEVKSSWYTKNLDKLDLNEFQAFITTDLIWIQEMVDFSYLNGILDALGDLPLVPISIGLQANYFNPDFKLHPETVKVLKRISERCIMGVRGYYTAYILAKYGITNFEVIGCPSMYMPGADYKKVHKNSDLLGKIAVNFAPFYGMQDKFRINFLEYCAKQKFSFIEQCQFYVSEENISDSMALSRVKGWIDSHSRCFFDAEQWWRYMSEFDFSMGLRFHGNVMALWAGIPALFINYDSRTKELCDFYCLPRINIEEFDVTKSIEYYYDLADYENFLERYDDCKNKYMSFLQKNNLISCSSASCDTSMKPTAILWCDYVNSEVKSKIGIARHFDDIGEISIIGITANDGIYKKFAGYKYFFKSDIDPAKIDYVIALETGTVFDKIRNEIMSSGFSDNVIIPVNSMLLDGFTVSKYNHLKSSEPTIFSNNCWGGITYHNLGFKFNSPTINMFILDDDYIKFLKNPKYYLSLPLIFDSLGYDERLRAYYPIAQCGDVLLYFNHYKSFEDAEECWKRRIQRVNWNNIFVMMYTEDKEIAAEFVKLPYKKKVCFVPFPSDEDSLLFVDYMPKISNNFKFWQVVNKLASNNFLYYDFFDLLSEGKVTKTIESSE